MNKVAKFTKAPTVSQMNKKVNELCDFTEDVVSHVNDTNNPHEVTPSLIGAAAESHTHDPGDITAGYLDKRVYHNLGVVANGSILPFVFNDISFLTNRGGSYSFYTTTATDYTANELSGKTALTTSLDACFNAQLNFVQLARATTDVAVIDVTLPKIFTYDTVFYIDFYIATFRANKITLLARNSNTETTWSQKGENLANSRQYWFVSLKHSSVNASGTTVQGFNQIRIVLTDFNSTDNRIAQIGLINRFSAGIQEVCISRNGSSNITGGLVPYTDNEYNLGSSSKKWKNVYATTFNGNATSADTAATATTLTGLTASITELNYTDGVTSNIQTQLDGKAASSHTHNYAGSASAGGPAAKIVSVVGTTNTDRPIFFGYNGDTSRVCYDTGFTYNPSTKILTAENLNVNAPIEYIKGTQTAATGSWTGKTRATELTNGQLILYWLPYNGSGNATLNLTLAGGSTTGAKPIYRYGTTYVTTQYTANSRVFLVYDATIDAWYVQGDYGSTTDTYNRTRWQNSIYAINDIPAARICVGSHLGYKVAANGVVFNLAYPILYNATEIDATKTGTNMYLAYPSVNFSSTHSIASGAAQRAIYLVGTLQGSNFTINSTVFTTVVPSSEDGLYYIPLGIMTSATVGYFYPRPDVYAYKNGAFSQVPSVNYLPKTAGSDNALTGDLHITKTNPGVVLASSAGYGNLAFNTTNNYLYLSANTSPQATNGGLILKPFGGSNAATMLQLYTTNSLGQTTYYNFKLEQA